jgi:hypothetical protein
LPKGPGGLWFKSGSCRHFQMKITRRSLFKTLAGATAAFVAKPVLDLIPEPEPVQIFFTTDGSTPEPGATGTMTYTNPHPFWLQDSRWAVCEDETTEQFLESIRSQVPALYAGAV